MNHKLTSYLILITVCLVSFSCETGSEHPELGTRVVSKLSDTGKFPVGDESKIYVAFRNKGMRKIDFWVQGDDPGKELKDSIDEAGEQLLSQESGFDSIEICIAHDFTSISPGLRNIRRWNMYRGIEGVEYKYMESEMTFCPTRMIANNENFPDTLRIFIQRYGYSSSVIADRGLSVKRFRANQFLFFPSSDNKKTGDRLEEMFRGNKLVLRSDVTKRSVRRLAKYMADWLVRSIQPDGRLVYKYWPSMGVESSANNMIRQFMGTIAIGRWKDFTGDGSIRYKHKSNLRYNMDRFYKEDRDVSVGYIQYGGKAKLGAASLAGIAIVESDIRGELGSCEQMLRNLTFRLWKENGRFRTFYKPERDDNHNFYPGEALLYWSILYSEDPDEMLLKRFMKSFEYYREWHLKNRNPAFIPWHTQAYYNIWKITGNEELKDFIFKMNDWLVSVMQGEEKYDDFKGRFYSRSPYYGPPHASSTGVYLEGLIDAYKLAKSTGDRVRQERYRRSILMGLRSVMQLQFTDEVDMFYVSRRDMVKGGIRTTVYDNEIRVDNVQHNLMAVIKILKEFRKEDYHYTGGESEL